MRLWGAGSDESQVIWYSPAVPETRPLQFSDFLPATEEAPSFVCDLCGKTFQGPPEGSGLFMWTRGDEVRTEEPPLCAKCASKLTLRALAAYADDGGDEE